MKEVRKMDKKVELYHGSGQIVEFPEVRKTRYTKDFSWGFYCTNNMNQAIRWANRGIGEPIINYYEYVPTENLKILRYLMSGWILLQNVEAEKRIHMIL